MDSQVSTRSWDATWQGMAEAEPPDFDAPSLANRIDALKLEFLKPLLPTTGVAVEVGCGSARLLARVGMASKLSLVGVDRSPEALKVASLTATKAGVTLECRCADALSLPFPTGSVDLMLSGGLLEHFHDPRPVLREMIRVLKPGGVFYADIVPRKFSLYRLREVLRMIRSQYLLPGVYESTLGPKYYFDAVAELGCVDVVVRSSGVYPQVAARHVLPWTTWLDGTFVADVFGWYFMVRARKRTAEA